MASLTLADIGRRMDPSGKIADMAELMSQCNEIDDDAPMVEGNLTTGHVVTLRTALPQGTLRRFNQGVGYTKSSAAQITFGMAMLDAYSQIDKKLADLGGNTNANREKEDVAHMEGMSQQWTGYLMYGNSWTTPAQFSGFSTYFSAIANTPNGVNVFNAGGTGSSNTSGWLIGWGDQTAYHIYPKGTKAGLIFENKGDVVPAYDSSSRRYEAYTSYFSRNGGLAIEDWRYVVRMANFDTTTAGLAGATPPDIFAIFSKAVVRLPTAGRMVSGITKTDAPDRVAPAVRLKFYCDRTLREYMDIQAIRDKNVLLRPEDYAGRPIVNFRNIAIGVVDQILDTESTVS
jgi:Major capsid protein GP7